MISHFPDCYDITTKLIFLNFCVIFQAFQRFLNGSYKKAGVEKVMFIFKSMRDAQ